MDLDRSIRAARRSTSPELLEPLAAAADAGGPVKDISSSF